MASWVFAQPRVLPDSILTPGATNSAVTQATIGQTICGPAGWIESVRPSTSYTNRFKRLQMVQYGYAGMSPKAFEEDHLISIELGGHPTDPHNLWPEPWDGPQGAHAKDVVENFLHRQVCSGRVTLDAAQRCIRTDWTRCKP